METMVRHHQHGGILVSVEVSTDPVADCRDDAHLMGRTMGSLEHDPAVESDDTKSDISPLHCGSIVPDVQYDPARDPEGKRFIPPLEITVRIKRQSSSSSSSDDDVTPAWLVLDQIKKLSTNVVVDEDAAGTKTIRVAPSQQLRRQQRRPRSLTPDKKEDAVVMTGITSAPSSPSETRTQLWHTCATTTTTSTPLTYSPSSIIPPKRLLGKPGRKGGDIHQQGLRSNNMVPVHTDLVPMLTKGAVINTTTVPTFANQVVPVSSFTDTVDTMGSETSSCNGLPHDVLPPKTTNKLMLKHSILEEDQQLLLLQKEEEEIEEEDKPIQQPSVLTACSSSKLRRGMVRREFQRRVLSKINMFHSTNNNKKGGTGRSRTSTSSIKANQGSNSLRQAIGGAFT
jgi:hypothetical protein